MSQRMYIGGMTKASPAHHLTVGILRRAGRRVHIGCRICNHVSEIAINALDLPAALPLASATRYLNCVVCGASNTDTEHPIYLSSLE